MVGRVLDFKREFCVSPHTPHLHYTLLLELTDSGRLTVVGALLGNSDSSSHTPASRRRIRSHINVVARYKGGLTRARQPSPVGLASAENHSASTSCTVHGFLRLSLPTVKAETVNKPQRMPFCHLYVRTRRTLTHFPKFIRRTHTHLTYAA